MLEGKEVKVDASQVTDEAIKVVASGASSFDHLITSGVRWVNTMLEIGMVKPGMRVLDFGAGVGRLSIPLKAADVNVVAVDRRDDMLDVLNTNGIETYEEKYMDAIIGNFDFVIANYVFQHNGKQQFKELIAELSKLSDTLYFTLPTVESCDAKWGKDNWPGSYIDIENTVVNENQIDCEISYVYREKLMREILFFEGGYKTVTKVDEFKNANLWKATKK